MNPLRLVGQFTPFIAPELEPFGQKAIAKTPFSHLPYGQFLERLAKYPGLVVGRLIVALAVCIFLSSLTLQAEYQNWVQTQIIDRFWPAINLNLELPNQSSWTNFWTDWNNSLSNLANNTKLAVERELWRKFSFEVLAGPSLVWLRGLGIFLIYSWLFWLFGTNIATLERKALQHQATLGWLAKSMLYKLQTKVNYWRMQQLGPKDSLDRLENIIHKAFQPKQTLTEEEIREISEFILK